MKPWQQNLEAAYSFKVDCCKKTVWGQDRPCQAGWPAYQRPKGRANACTLLNCDLLLLCQHDHCEKQNLETAYSFKVNFCKKAVCGHDRPRQGGRPIKGQKARLMPVPRSTATYYCFVSMIIARVMLSLLSTIMTNDHDLSHYYPLTCFFQYVFHGLILYILTYDIFQVHR